MVFLRGLAKTIDRQTAKMKNINVWMGIALKKTLSSEIRNGSERESKQKYSLKKPLYFRKLLHSSFKIG